MRLRMVRGRLCSYDTTVPAGDGPIWPPRATEASMILRVSDIPPYEMHLIPVADLRQQIKRDRRAVADVDHELQARQRSLAAVGEDDIDWECAPLS